MPEEVVKTKDKPPKAAKKPKTLLNKVVIRKLPPNFNEQEFLNSIHPTEYVDFYFVNADYSLGADASSRAYIEFKSQEDIFLFKDKFDGYVFIDSRSGTEYPAVVEYAPFQGLPKARARKDKHVGTIETEPHFINFIESLTAEDEQKERKLEFTFQLKDDKKITSTPLLEFLAAAKEEKRDAKKKKQEERKKHRDEERQRKKKEVAKNVPEPIKESKEEIVYDDGVVVRTVPSRLGPNRNEKNVAKKETPRDGGGSKDNNKLDKDALEKERKLKNQEKAEERKIRQRERDEKRRQEREQQRAKEREAREKARQEKKAETATPTVNEEPPKSSSQQQQQPAKKEVKRYSELRKARQEKTSDPQETVESSKEGAGEVEKDSDLKENHPKTEKQSDEDPRWKKIQEARDKRAQYSKKNEKKSKNEDKSSKNDEKSKAEPEKLKSEPTPLTEDDKWKKIQDAREKRAREKEERAQREREDRAARNIRNKDRPSMQIYRPKRTSGGDGKTDEKSSDEKSEKGGTRKRSDSIKSEKRDRGDKKRRNSRDERRKRGGRKGSSNDDEVVENLQKSEEKSQQEEEKLIENQPDVVVEMEIQENQKIEAQKESADEQDEEVSQDEIQKTDGEKIEIVEEKLEKLTLEVPSEEKSIDNEN